MNYHCTSQDLIEHLKGLLDIKHGHFPDLSKATRARLQEKLQGISMTEKEDPWIHTMTIQQLFDLLVRAHYLQVPIESLL